MAEFLACEPNVVRNRERLSDSNLAEPGPVACGSADAISSTKTKQVFFYNDRCVHKISVPQSVLDEAESYTVMATAA